MLIPIPLKEKQPGHEHAQSGANVATDENSLKRKLLGAAVLLALSVIFLPLLLDGSGSESRFRRVENVRQEPPRVIGVDGVVEVPRQLENEIAPETESVEAVEPVIVVKKEEITAPAPAGTEEVVAKVESPTVLPQVQTPVQPQEPDPIPVAAALEAVDVHEQTPAIETLPNTGAWIIQAASFVDEFKALDLRDKMRSRGYPAFISTVGVTIAGVDSVRFRVKVGPLTDRTVIDQRRREIARLTGAEPLVKAYQ